MKTHIQATTPDVLEHAIRGEFVAVLVHWTNRDAAGGTHTRETGEAKTRAAIAALDAALAKLGSRKGTREDAARAYITNTRAKLAAALAVFESIGAELEGPAYTAIVKRVVDAVTSHEDAEAALLECDDLADLPALQHARDTARVERNAAVKAKAALLASARLPASPNLEHFATAEEQSRQLALVARVTDAPMTGIHQAFEQAVRTPREVALLWPCFEVGAASDLYQYRAARYSEEHAPAAAAAAE